MKKTTVIFDMDGTVLSTLEDITNSVNYIMNQYQLPNWTIEDIRHFVGNGAGVLIEKAIPGGRENLKYQEVLENYEAYYLEHCNEKTGPYEGILELMAELKKRHIKMAIVSNKGMDAVQELREKYFADYVDVAVGVTADLKRKPAPDECLAAMRALGVEKEECVYVGDSEVDYQTAMNTGISCISCLWGFRTKEELLKAGAKDNYYVEKPMEILKFLEE